jgi:hypothetical protein
VGDVVLLALAAPAHQAMVLPLRLDSLLSHDAHSVMYRVTATQGALPATALAIPDLTAAGNTPAQSIQPGLLEAQPTAMQLQAQRYVLRILLSSDDLGLQVRCRTLLMARKASCYRRLEQLGSGCRTL